MRDFTDGYQTVLPDYRNIRTFGESQKLRVGAVIKRLLLVTFVLGLILVNVSLLNSVMQLRQQVEMADAVSVYVGGREAADRAEIANIKKYIFSY